MSDVPDDAVNAPDVDEDLDADATDVVWPDEPDLDEDEDLGEGVPA